MMKYITSRIRIEHDGMCRTFTMQFPDSIPKSKLDEVLINEFYRMIRIMRAEQDEEASS